MALSLSMANRLLDDLSITQDDLLKHLDEIARARGALVVEGQLDGSDARLNMAGEPAIITVASRVTEPTRRRFSIAHELGHLEMHRWKVTLCTSTDMMDWSLKEGSQAVELEANEFAAALLMPERFFASLCDDEPSMEYFIDLASRFRVSLTAAAIRYCRFTPEPVAVVLSQDGIIRWFRSSREFDEMDLFVDVRSCVYPGSRPARYFEGKSLPTTATRVHADTWLRSGNYNRDASVQEQSWSIDSINAVLTLLWVDGDLEEEDDVW